MPKLRRLLSVAALAFFACASPLTARADTGIVPLAPHPGEHVQTSRPDIVAQLPKGDARTLVAGKVTLLLDGYDRSDAVIAADGRVRYTPVAPLASGEHAVEIDVTDASGGRLSYQWTFTVDGAGSTDSSNSNATTYAPSSAPSYDASYATQYATPGFPSFYTLNQAPFYWGDGIRFLFVGAPGGFGFVTFGGIPGFFNLIPFGFNTYYVLVPVPIGFAAPSPFIACHFFPPVGTPVVVPYPHRVVIIGRRNPPTRSLLNSQVIARFAHVAAARFSPTMRRRPVEAGPLPVRFRLRIVPPGPRTLIAPRMLTPLPGPRAPSMTLSHRPLQTR